MLNAKPREFQGARGGTRVVAAHEFEYGRQHFSQCMRGDIGKARDPRLSVADERTRAIHLARCPCRKRQPGHGSDASVLSEAKCQIVVATRLE